MQLIDQWESAFGYPSGSKLGLLGAIQNIGSLGALPFTPYLCDGLGRKRTIFIGALIVVAGAIIQTASQNVEMFIGSRFMRTSFYKLVLHPGLTGYNYSGIWTRVLRTLIWLLQPVGSNLTSFCI